MRIAYQCIQNSGEDTIRCQHQNTYTPLLSLPISLLPCTPPSPSHLKRYDMYPKGATLHFIKHIMLHHASHPKPFNFQIINSMSS